MKNTKRIIAAVLTVIMMVSMLPSNAFATEQTDGEAAESAMEAVSESGQEQEIESDMEAVTDESSDAAEAVQGSSDEVQTVDNAEPAEAEETEQTAEIPAETEVFYPEQDFEESTDLVTVRVHAPEGALPKDTEMHVEEVEKTEVEDLVNEATEDEVSDFIAVDISFRVKGQEEDIEPLREVEVEFALEKDALPETESYDVIHVAVDEEKGTETPEIIEEEKIIDEITAEGGTISQKDFSVFIIAAKDTPSSQDTATPKPTYAVATWYFYANPDDISEISDERDAFEAAGEGADPADYLSCMPEYTQALKSGDVLVEPTAGIAADEDEIFDGWYELKDDGSESKVTFGPVGDVVSGDNHYVYAKMVPAYYVTFYDAKVPSDTSTDKNVVKTVKAAEGKEVSTNVIVETNDPAKTHAGWATSPDAPQAEYGLGEEDKLTVGKADVDLYPVFIPGYTVIFEGNEGDDPETKSSYIAPQYVAPNTNAERPAPNPKRDGYDFVGWYTDPACSDGNEFDFDTRITGNTSIYAKWDERQANVTIIIWKQKVSDLANDDMSDNTYDYDREYTVKVPTGSSIIKAAGTDLTGGEPGEAFDYTTLTTNQETANAFKGFEFQEDNPKNVANENVVVKGSGTVVNVYYDRKTVTFTFPDGTDIYIKVPSGTGTHIYYEDTWSSGYYRGDQGPLGKNISGEEDCWVYNVITGNPMWLGDKLRRYAWRQPAQYGDEIVYYETNVWRHSSSNYEIMPDEGNGMHGYLHRYTRFYKYENATGFHEKSGGDYKLFQGTTMIGLYGQNMAEIGAGWPWGEWYYTNSDGSEMHLTTMGTFSLLEDAPDPYNVSFHPEVNPSGDNNRPTATLYIYCQMLDDDGNEKYVLTNRATLGMSYREGNTYHPSIWYFTEKYPDTHKLDSYYWGAAYAGADDDEGGGSGTNISYQPIPANKQIELKYPDYATSATDMVLYIRYNLRDFNITFDNCRGTPHSSQILYGAPLTESVAPTPQYPDADEEQYYTFDAWYADPQFTEKVEFGSGQFKTMPSTNLVVYAKWIRAKEKVTVDFNGGKIGSDTTEEFAVEHGAPFDPAAELDNAVPVREGYDFVGWVKGDENGPAWNSEESIVGDMTVVAKWRRGSSTALTLTYYAIEDGDYTVFEIDSDKYYAGTYAEVTHSVPESDSDFVGWSTASGAAEAEYYAGQMYEIKPGTDANKLYAVYKTYEPKKTSVKIYTNLEGATLEKTDEYGSATADGDGYIEYTDLDVNSYVIDLGKITGTHSSMMMDGWATSANGDKVFDLDDKVTADQIGENKLYAHWTEGKFFVYLSEEGRTVQCDMPVGDNATYNIASLKGDNYLYGGYYHYDDHEEPTEENPNPAHRGTPYTKEKQDAPGTALKPKMGETYYLKQVSKEYLAPQVYIVWSKYQNFTLRQMHIMTIIDEQSYRDFGVKVECDDAVETISYGINSYDGIIVTNQNSSGEGVSDPPIPTKSIFWGLEGWMGIQEANKYVGNAYKGKILTMNAYFVTPDAVRVTGTVNRVIDLGDLTYQGWAEPGIQSYRGDELPSTMRGVTTFTSPASVRPSSGTYIINNTEVEGDVTITKVDNGSTTEQTGKAGNYKGMVSPAGRDGYVFAGWYTDSAYRTAADFTDVKQDMTVYAKYVKTSDIKLSFKKKSVSSDAVTLTSTLKVTGAPGITNAAVNCTFNGNEKSVIFGTPIESQSGTSVMYTYTDTVAIPGLVNKSVFTAVISFVTPDGTEVKIAEKTCKYSSGYVTVK